MADGVGLAASTSVGRTDGHWHPQVDSVSEGPHRGVLGWWLRQRAECTERDGPCPASHGSLQCSPNLSLSIQITSLFSDIVFLLRLPFSPK